MYAGFYGAEQHHLWTLPVQHLLDATAFKLFGAGIAQARWVSVVAAVSVLVSVGWFALRWYGLPAALLAEMLLVFWRSNLTLGATGLPLLDVARVARYDVLAVAFGCLTLFALSSKAPTGSVAAGVSAGLAALSQFFGVAALPVALLASRNRLWTATAAGVTAAPWLAFLALNHADLAGQFSVYGARGAFLRPGFYAENILAEPTRFAGVLQQPGGWLLLGLLPALVWLVRQRNGGSMLLALNLASCFFFLTVVDQTKTPLYAILLVPSICLLLAASWSALPRNVLWLVATAVLTGAIVYDGLGAYTVDRAESQQVTAYQAVGDRIEGALPMDGVVLGPERFWWAAHDHSYISLRSLWFQWASAGGAVPFAQLAARWQPRSIIVNNNVRDDIRAFPPELATEFWTYVGACAQPRAEFDDPTYFDIQIYLIAVTGC
jgi:4-amino-4-deoxy-L-arabinose transferase-like glycosyltransferase